MDRNRCNQILVELLKDKGQIRHDSELLTLEPGDWDTLIELALWHSVAALVYERVEHLDLPNLTLDKKRRLQTISLYNQWNNTCIYAKLQRFLHELDRVGLPIIVLKGAHLVALVYQNFSLRTMSDIDLLIHKHDLTRIEDVLYSLEYQCICNRHLYERSHFHFIYHLKEPGYNSYIELHWDLHPENSAIRIDQARLWQRARPETIAQEKVLVLCPEDFVLHQIHHLAVHHGFFFGLRPLRDIKETLSFYGDRLNWIDLVEQARSWNIENSVYLTLTIMNQLFEARIPAEVIASLKPADEQPLFLNTALANIFEPRSQSKPLISSHIPFLRTQKGLFTKLARVIKAVFVPPDLLRKQYFLTQDSPWVWFYYFVRIKDILVRQFRPLLGIIRRDKKIIAQIQKMHDLNELNKWLKVEDEEHSH
ncbi:nucleotidyltransferase family protein [bacterium]|nr:nucleotidyltransferase family protein [bacterium]